MEQHDSIEEPKTMKAKDFLSMEASNPNYSTELRIFIGSLIEAVNNTAELSDGQRNHVGSVLRNKGQRICEINQSAEQFEALDELTSDLATFINTCH